MSSYRVLVVDDNHEVRRMVTASIKTLGAEIDVLDVPSAEEALFISASLPLDLVVLDYRLPGMSGLEMVSLLQKRKPGIKIILVTGVEDAESRQQVSEANVAAHFFKPIEVDAFLKAIQNCLWPHQEVVSLPPPSPIVNEVIAVKEPAPEPRFQPGLGDRLSALRQQVSAVSVILVSEVGQIVERAGEAGEITANPFLLPALMDAFRASQKVSDAFGKQASESLFFFTQSRQHIFLTPIDPSYVLLVLTAGYIEPDKLGMVDRAIHLAASDLRELVESMPEGGMFTQDSSVPPVGEPPAEVMIYQETLAGVADMFSKASQEEIRQEADGFWDSLSEKGALDGKTRKDVLSYDEARDMGLAPEEDQGL